MQNKKSLLQRLLAIYITFFIVLAISIGHSIIPHFNQGFDEGAKMGNDIVKNWSSGTPHLIYTLGDIVIKNGESQELSAMNPKVTAKVTTYNLTVEEDAPDASVMGLAFSAIGGSAWYYLLVMINPLAYLAVLVFMGIIIYSLRRSIREETTLNSRNIWYLRAIGGLTILMEVIQSFINWRMATKAAEMLSQYGYVVNDSFQISYTNIIMGILVLFAAEVFALGYNLSEEQKLTI